MEFNCLLNLKRHKFIHNATNNTDYSERRDDICTYWDSLTPSHTSQLLSLEGKRILKVAGEALIQIMEQSREEADPRIGTLLDAIVNRDKLSSKELFSLLDDTSEKTFLMLDIVAFEDQLFGETIESIQHDFRTVMAYYSYMIEKFLVKERSDSIMNELIMNDNIVDRIEKLRAEDLNILKETEDKVGHIDDGYSSAHNSLSHDLCAQFLEFFRQYRKGEEPLPYYEYVAISMKYYGALNMIICNLHLKKHNRELALLVQDEYESVKPHLELAATMFLSESGYQKPDGELLEGITVSVQEGDVPDALCTQFLEFYRQYREGQDRTPFYEYSAKSMKCCGISNMRIYYPHLKEHNPELALQLQDDYESFKPHLELAATLYLAEKDYLKPDGGLLEGITVSIHDMPCVASNMSFRKFLQENKLVKSFRIPRRYRRFFKNHINGIVKILTYCGRKAARGFINFIIRKHKDKWCWGGDWNLSDMQLVNGSFIITKPANVSLNYEGMMDDFKRYMQLVLINFCGPEKSQYPAYFLQLEDDLLVNVPQIEESQELERFRKYLSAHLAFMPPVSRSELFCQLYKVCDSLRESEFVGYEPLCEVRILDGEDWTLAVGWRHIFCDVFYYNSKNNRSNYQNLPWHLLRYSRNFVQHMHKYTKVNGLQHTKDLILTDLMMADSLTLGGHLGKLLRLMVELNNMEGPFFRTWESYLKSDDFIEYEDVEDREQLESEDDEEMESHTKSTAANTVRTDATVTSVLSDQTTVQVGQLKSDDVEQNKEEDDVEYSVSFAMVSSYCSKSGFH